MNLDGPPPVIKLQDLTKVFSTEEVETHALSNVNVQIERGEYVSIAGPSGCGKSTLLSILGLLDSPTQGSYELNGRPVAELRASERARVRNREIGFIFQSFNLIGDLTVFENVELPLTWWPTCWIGFRSSRKRICIRISSRRAATVGRRRARPHREAASDSRR
jgi:predicted ABC-type transport system involved in lysophospholipase L1 biosynthesis ATPase subunit